MRNVLAIATIGGAMLLVGCRSEEADKTVVTTGAGQTGTASPSTQAADDRGVSMVRFVNAMTGSAALDVMSDSLALFPGVAFATVTPYREVRDNVRTFSLRQPGREAQLVANTETMRDGARYTFVALTDREGGATLHVLTDDFATDSSKARVRVMNAAANEDDIDVLMTGERDALFDDVDYGTDAGFKAVAPGRIGFTVRRGENPAVAATVRTMLLQAGKSYTVVLTGTGKAGAALSAMTFSDELVGPSSGAAAARGDTASRRP